MIPITEKEVAALLRTTKEISNMLESIATSLARMDKRQENLEKMAREGMERQRQYAQEMERRAREGVPLNNVDCPECGKSENIDPNCPF